MIFGAAGVSGAAATYIEDVFSTWLYTGNGGAQAQVITNGIDLAGKGGLVWLKQRSLANHVLFDSARGASSILVTDSTGGSGTGYPFSFTATGFSLSTYPTLGNTNGETYASWTFREAAKFFDVVTYTGNGANRTIAHNLGSVPGCIIVKRTDTTGDWQVYHTSLANTEYLVLNSLNATATGTTRWNSTTPTSSVFSLGTDATVNANGGTYVAYLFAHDAGGFGNSGNESVIKCGSYTGNGSATGPTIDLGWEPQWLLIKGSSGGGNWSLLDNMRGIATGGNDAVLYAQLSDAEFAGGNNVSLTATGFQITTNISAFNTNGSTYIYIAIRRGPMKTPTDATKVFDVEISNSNGSATVPEYDTGFPVDAMILTSRTASDKHYWASRLTGNRSVNSTNTNIEANFTVGWDFSSGVFNSALSSDYMAWLFRRAPGFFDVACWTNSSNLNQRVFHGLGVVPELIFTKTRDIAGLWYTYASPVTSQFQYLSLNGQAGVTTNGTQLWGTSAPSALDFGINNTGTGTGFSGSTQVAYLFASCPGVSKVGSYTGTGTTLQVNCGFTNGARFVLIKRTDNTGDWYVWDTARGIIAANDPYLLLNSSAAEVTNTDYIDPYSAGFEISSTAPAAINANGGTYIYLAIA